jgi:plastocyanin
MAIERRIVIKPNAPGASPRVTFDPNPLQANPSDQIFWANNDTQAHWPGRKNADGTINATFFMSNQIAPGGDVSPVFSTIVNDTLTYICTIAGHQNETGSIVISTTPAP